MARRARTLTGKLFRSMLTMMLIGAGCMTLLGNIPAMATAAPGVITTVAGNGSPGYTGDGGPATSAELDEGMAIYATQGVAVDAAGNLYIAGINRSFRSF